MTRWFHLLIKNNIKELVLGYWIGLITSNFPLQLSWQLHDFAKYTQNESVWSKINQINHSLSINYRRQIRQIAAGDLNNVPLIQPSPSIERWMQHFPLPVACRCPNRSVPPSTSPIKRHLWTSENVTDRFTETDLAVDLRRRCLTWLVQGVPATCVFQDHQRHRHSIDNDI